MTRPEIIRADSIDLQNHDAPSAQGNSARPTPLQTKLSPNSASPATFAPHQAETLREVAAETAEEETKSPRVSWANGAEAGDLHQYAQDLAAGVTSSLAGGKQNGGGEDSNTNNMDARAQQDALAVAQNGGVVSRDNAEDVDMEGEEGDLDDDDMMDKISSSPSIEDGGFLCQLPAFNVVQRDASPCSSPASACFSEARSSSPYLDLPDYLPLQRATQQDAPEVPAERPPSRHHHHLLPGAFPEAYDEQSGNEETIQGLETETTEDGMSRGGSGSSSQAAMEYNEFAERPVASIDSTDEGSSDKNFQVDVQLAKYEVLGDIEDEGVDVGDLVVPYEDSTDEDDDDDLSLQSTNPRFIDSGWGDECLHEAEDIDFELVYALHTFIATVEGQANATKGDAMVLLDDSNSYWWLVRVVKDSSIGYLPAEHIETPTERLARLNKHRNIDLSATMLGDQAEKAKAPIKITMRRKKAKNVSFAAPTFVDYSDYDYDTEEEEEEEAKEMMARQRQQQQTQQSQSQASATNETNGDAGDKDEESAKVAPLRPRTQKTVQVVDPAESNATEESSSGASKPTSRTSEEIFETNGVEGPKKRADGTVRDSFFKDDTVETKKITLTPGLLRDDGVARASTDSLDKGISKRPSFDKLLEKDSKEDKKKAKEKKEKEKKGGFRSLFSRKDKKRGDEDDESFGKRSMDVGNEPTERPSEDVGDDLEKVNMSPQRNPSKLQKQQARVEPSLVRKTTGAQKDPGDGMDLSAFLNESNLKTVSSVPPASMRIVDLDADLFEDDEDEEEKPKPQPSAAARSTSLDDYKQPAPKQTPARSQSADDPKPTKPVKPTKTTAAKSRMQIEDFDSEDEVQEIVRTQVAKDEAPNQPQPEPQEQPTQPEKQKPARPVLPGAFPDSYVSAVSTESASTVTAEKAGAANQPKERLSESPIEVSPITPLESQPPPLTGDNSSQEHSSPVSSPSPELIDRDEADGAHRNQDSITTSTSTTTVSGWNDTSLRAFFDSGADIRDLLVVVYDKNDVEPVGSDHPVAGALFKEQNAKLAEITTQLDNMLGDWLARKQRLRGTV